MFYALKKNNVQQMLLKFTKINYLYSFKNAMKYIFRLILGLFSMKELKCVSKLMFDIFYPSPSVFQIIYMSLAKRRYLFNIFCHHNYDLMVFFHIFFKGIFGVLYKPKNQTNRQIFNRK